MATNSGAPREPFHLRMLFNDARLQSPDSPGHRILHPVPTAWLVEKHEIRNLAALERISFGFLGSKAGYDIAPHAIDDSSTSTNARVRP
ncbi:hypothetical protein [Sinorhizobium psoraleae]|uniref:Uncharacterized protein n=1 Tax=Sinorhizobium psoraleae TaxID=520838 RepID=A0ABT4KAJ4_9HYPH|nr:hypothetical protein [Sinorhizobium psoraleae]MCZ4088845.1 hypothetical protein [Sinorhizobium psoraleae]